MNGHINERNYINKNGIPSTCWICKQKYAIEWSGNCENMRRVYNNIWYVRTIAHRPYATANLIYVAHSYTEARAKQLVFLEKAKRNVKR